MKTDHETLLPFPRPPGARPDDRPPAPPDEDGRHVKYHKSEYLCRYPTLTLSALSES